MKVLDTDCKSRAFDDVHGWMSSYGLSGTTWHGITHSISY